MEKGEIAAYFQQQICYKVLNSKRGSPGTDEGRKKEKERDSRASVDGHPSGFHVCPMYPSLSDFFSDMENRAGEASKTS